jgi:glycine/D-amino acid oxidase-like deaminating enzyme
MTSPGQGPRVAVVGGGILGVSTAAHLAQRGAAVTLLTEHGLSSGATGRSLSWLNSYGPRTPEYHELRLAGLERYRRLATQIDASAWLKFDGGLTWPAAGEVGGHRAAFEHMQQVGYDAEWLTPAQVAERTPGVDITAIPDEGAIFNPGEGWVELPPLVEHLAGQLVRSGGEIRAAAGPARIVVAGGRVTGVRTAGGEVIGVDAAVLATGADVPATVADLGVKIPDATPIALLVRTPRMALPLRAVLNTPRAAVRPTPNGSLYIDSGWSEEEVVTRDDGTYEVRDSTVQGLLREASAVLEGNPVLTAESYGVGPKPIPGDGEPVLGALPEVAGYHVAFTHSGATLGLIAGELLADEIVRGEPSPLLETFRPGRFDQYHPARTP